MSRIKGRFFLMIAALVAAGLSWTVWDPLGNSSFTILGAVMLLILIIENNSLRTQIQKLERKQRLR